MEQLNPLLAKLRLPGRTFQLPSRGALYRNGELSSEAATAEIHVHPMTALTEINLKNQDLLFNGKAIEAVVAECVPEIKKPLELFGRDVDALLFFLRLTTYGSEFRIEVKHTCTDAKEHSYVVNLEELIMSMKFLDPSLVEQKRRVTLSNGQCVVTRPLRFRDIVNLYHLSGQKKELTPDDVKELAITNLLSMIESVDDIVNPQHIEGWCRGLTTPMMNSISEAAEKLNDWGPDQITKIKCKDCGEIMSVELPLNPVSFFTA